MCLDALFVNFHKIFDVFLWQVNTQITELRFLFCCRSLLKLASVLWDNDIPLIVCRCYGFIGYMRLVVREHTGDVSLSQIFYVTVVVETIAPVAKRIESFTLPSVYYCVKTVNILHPKGHNFV